MTRLGANRNFAPFAVQLARSTRERIFPETAAAMTRSALTFVATSLLACVALTSLSSRPAEARHRAPAPAKEDHASEKTPDAAPGKPVQVGTFGDWGAYLAKGRSKTCYALAMPKERKPEGKKDTAYVFIADRPAEKVHNEVSIMMGFPIKESGAAQAKVGSTSFDLVAKGSNAWIKNPAEEAQVRRRAEAHRQADRDRPLDEGQGDHRHLLPRRPQAGAREGRKGLQVGPTAGGRPSRDDIAEFQPCQARKAAKSTNRTRPPMKMNFRAGVRNTTCPCVTCSAV